MNKIVFVLISSFFLFVNTAQAQKCESRLMYKELLADIYFQDMRWRRPDLKFTVQKTSNIIIVTGEKYHREFGWKGQSRYGITMSAYNDVIHVINMAPHEPFYLTPILPSIFKSNMNFKCLPLGFEIINPDYGFIKERWDGVQWLKPNQRTNRNFNTLWNHGITE